MKAVKTRVGVAVVFVALAAAGRTHAGQEDHVESSESFQDETPRAQRRVRRYWGKLTSNLRRNVKYGPAPGRRWSSVPLPPLRGPA